MIEIVFGDSACGGLKMAQHCGMGDYIGGCIGVILTKGDGSQPTAEEIDAAQQSAEEQARREWEAAVPMGGNSEDVFGLNLMLSIGDISGDDFANKRRRTIDELWSIYPNDPDEVLLDVAGALQTALDAIRERLLTGAAVRIWYSDQPDELCGLYWFMAELLQMDVQPSAVYIVKLPAHEYREDNVVVTHYSWGEISPGDWHRYTALAEETTAVFRQYCASRWKSLRSENAPLRAVLNGHLLSVPEAIYDSFIWREIEAEENEFREVMVIGRVLGRYHLGIGDSWVAHRIETMVRNGKLAVASAPVKDRPSYDRRLRKI